MSERFTIYSVSAAMLITALLVVFGVEQARQKLPPGTNLVEYVMQRAFSTSEQLDTNANWEMCKSECEKAEKSSEQKPQVNFVAARAVRPTDEHGRPNYLRGQIIVRFREGTTPARQERIIASFGARVLEILDGKNGEYLIAVPAGTNELDFIQRFAAGRDVVAAEPDYLYYPNTAPSDALYTGFQNRPDELQRWCFAGIAGDACLNAEAAWELTTGRDDVVVAVIDTGVALAHPDLAGNIWTNPREIPDNGLDDDGNGFVDDVSGWDFYRNTGDPSPELGDGAAGDGNVFHGTFVAGAIAAVSDNGIGTAGASWRSRIMPLKVFADDGGAPASAISRAIYYAANNGADLINMSFGSSAASSAISGACAYAWSKGLVLVAAAGNGNSSARQYPARFPRVISVGATGGNGFFSGKPGAIRNRAGFSQYGAAAVDVVAPGMDLVAPAVYSVADQLAGHGQAGAPAYFYGNGTSFSSALVAGEAALLISRARDLGLDGQLVNEDYRRILLAGVVDLPDDPTDSPDGGAAWDGRGRVDFLAAVQSVVAEQVRKPTSPLNLKGTTWTGAVRLTWRDRSKNEQGFRVERARRNNYGYEPYEVVAELPANTTTFCDTTVQPTATYIYRVSSFNAAGACAHPLRRLVTAR